MEKQKNNNNNNKKKKFKLHKIIIINFGVGRTTQLKIDELVASNMYIYADNKKGVSWTKIAFLLESS